MKSDFAVACFYYDPIKLSRERTSASLKNAQIKIPFLRLPLQATLQRAYVNTKDDIVEDKPVFAGNGIIKQGEPYTISFRMHSLPYINQIL